MSFGMMEALLSFIRRQVGLRTDSADPNGSLHAKVKDIKDNRIPAINSKIGTPSDTRASNTVMGWLNTQIKSVQRGETGASPGSGTNVTISSVNTSKAVVIAYGKCADDRRMHGGGITAKLTSSTNLNLSSGFNDGGVYWGAANVSWQVIEFY